jgi:Helix-turn-helix of DDE superfamily endonuclease
MTHEDLQSLPPPAFKRACGLSRPTFALMVEVLRPHLERHGKRGGQNRLSVEDQLLMTLQYWREYRTQFHIGLDFGVSESTVCRTIEKVETLLVRSGQFRLPGRQQLHQNTWMWRRVPLSAPKKTETILFWQAQVPYLESPSDSRLEHGSLPGDCLWERSNP